jgi:hypothetical protein
LNRQTRPYFGTAPYPSTSWGRAHADAKPSAISCGNQRCFNLQLRQWPELAAPARTVSAQRTFAPCDCCEY